LKSTAFRYSAENLSSTRLSFADNYPPLSHNRQ
jgi:hypothetical protein